MELKSKSATLLKYEMKSCFGHQDLVSADCGGCPDEVRRDCYFKTFDEFIRVTASEFNELCCLRDELERYKIIDDEFEEEIVVEKRLFQVRLDGQEKREIFRKT